MKQDLGGESLELICSWDGGSTQDWKWLEAFVAALGPRGRVEVRAAAGDTSVNPAGETTVAAHELFEGTARDRTYPTVAEVADACRAEHSVTVVRYVDGLNRGQGAAMSLGLTLSRAPIVAHMESDDVRPRSDALRHLVEALRNHHDWAAACTEAYCFGDVVSKNMMDYCDWQNSLVDPEQLAAERFVEIPALQQTSAVRREVVDALLGIKGMYRDGPRGDCRLDTPVDLWWWLDFFDKGFRCGRVRGSKLNHAAHLPPGQTFFFDPPPGTYFGWRQHATQRTRDHARLSLDNLRAIKIYFLLKAYPDRRRILVVSVGRTLENWVRDLRSALKSEKAAVTGVEWRPTKRRVDDGPPQQALRPSDGSTGLLRLWAYGSSKIRARLPVVVPDWDARSDVLVA